MELFKVWLKGSQNGYFFSFSIHKGHIIVQTNRHNKTSIQICSYRAPIALIFFPGAAYYLQKLLSPVKQRKKLPIRLIYLTNVVEVIVFEPIKIFQSNVIQKNKTKTEKLNVRRVLLN